MANARFSCTPYQTEDIAGLPNSTAVMWFTVPGTNTDLLIYDDDGNAITNPVAADSTGAFPPVFGDDATPARIRLFADTDTGGTPLFEIDSELPGSAFGYTVGTSGAKLGLLNANKTDSGNNTTTGSNTHSGSEEFTGAVDMSNAASVALIAGATVGDYRAGFREIPLTQKNANYTLVLTDAGKGYYKDDTSAYAWTIPPNSSVAFPVGTVIYFLNNGSSGAITVTRGSGVALRLAGAAGPDDYDIAAYGEATITKVGTDAWVIRGTSVST